MIWALRTSFGAPVSSPLGPAAPKAFETDMHDTGGDTEAAAS